MSYLIDTDWIVNVLRGVPADVRELKRLRDAGISVSIVSYGELCEGIAASPDSETESALIDAFLAPFSVIPLDTAIWRRFGALRYQLRRQGQLIPDFDLLIAATGLCYDLTLVTHNVRHFARIPGLRLYRPA